MADEKYTMPETLSSDGPLGEPGHEIPSSDDPNFDEPAPSRRLWLSIGFGLAAVLAIAAGIASLISVPYTAFELGTVNPIEDIVEIEGAETFASEGELYFTTVRLNRLSALEWVFVRFGPAVDIRDTEAVFGTQTQEESRQCNAQMMVSSQSTANIVALTYLGYDVFDPTGVTVDGVADESAADNVIECGDVIIEAGGEEVLTTNQLRDAVLARQPGDVLELVVERDGEPTELSVPLGEVNGEARIGVSIGTRLSENDLPIDLSLNVEGVGGPSAGLAFTLSYIDLLTEGELTGGNDVAVTGTMALSGGVGPIGGVRQKVAAAIRSGATYMLIPASLRQSELDRAFAEAGEDIEIIPVANVQEAIDALADRGGNGRELVGPNGPVGAPAES